MNYTSRSDFPETLPSKKTLYCWNCHAEGATRKDSEGHASYWCNACKTDSARVLIYDPNMIQQFDKQNRLIHESCGVFIKRADGKILLFQRTKFPFLLTIPAGHLEVGEDPDLCAIRETKEEVGITPHTISKVFDNPIEGDSCLGGADIHHWHAYVAFASRQDEASVKLDEEGSGWNWYSPSELNASNTVQPVLYLLKQIAL